MAQSLPQMNWWQRPCSRPQTELCSSAQEAESWGDASTPHAMQSSTDDLGSSSARLENDFQENLGFSTHRSDNGTAEQGNYGEDFQSEGVAPEECHSQPPVLRPQAEDTPSRTSLGPQQPLHQNMQFVWDEVQESVLATQSRGARGRQHVLDPELITPLQPAEGYRYPAALESVAEDSGLPVRRTGPHRRFPPRPITFLQPAVGSGQAALQQRDAASLVHSMINAEEGSRGRRMPSLRRWGTEEQWDENEADFGPQHSRALLHSDLIRDALLIQQLFGDRFGGFLEEQDAASDGTRGGFSEGTDPPSHSSSGS
eukprot:TRINITY_DN33516_c0_g1_i1.p1 TRINITY_DN33516_c0_g1~~TRINITY_DN33516_c0_g1_i1.p1  ORF type:complete len:313 (-),score=54.42 TRINITY_DN33516_c0_g1_i1:22-960(-)